MTKLQFSFTVFFSILILYNIYFNNFLQNFSIQFKESFNLHPNISIDEKVIDFGLLRSDSIYNHVIKSKILEMEIYYYMMFVQNVVVLHLFEKKNQLKKINQEMFY